MPMIPSAPIEANAACRYVLGLQPGCFCGHRTRSITWTAMGEGVVSDPTVTRASATGPAKVSPPPKVAAITRPVRVLPLPIALGSSRSPGEPVSSRTGTDGPPPTRTCTMARTAATPPPKFSWVIVTGIVAVFGAAAFPQADSRQATATVAAIAPAVKYRNRDLSIALTVSARSFALGDHQHGAANPGDRTSPQPVDLPHHDRRERAQDLSPARPLFSTRPRVGRRGVAASRGGSCVGSSGGVLGQPAASAASAGDDRGGDFRL